MEEAADRHVDAVGRIEEVILGVWVGAGSVPGVSWESCILGDGSWGSRGPCHPAPCCLLQHSCSKSPLSASGRERQVWCLVAVPWGWRMCCEMQSQLLPRGAMHLQAVTVPPLVTGTPGITGNQGKFFMLSPSAPRAPVPFMHRLFTAYTVLVICWHFISHSLSSFKNSPWCCGCVPCSVGATYLVWSSSGIPEELGHGGFSTGAAALLCHCESSGTRLLCASS